VASDTDALQLNTRITTPYQSLLVRVIRAIRG